LPITSLRRPESVAESDGTASRKADHLRINVERDVSAKGIGTGFEAYSFVHCALPELDLDEVDLSTAVLGHRLRAPFLISSMTGGTPEARRINLILAKVAQQFGFAMGLGSARVLLEHSESLDSFDVRACAPSALLLANLGAVQLNKGYGVDECRRILDLLRADALVLHLNPLHEAVQPEGDTNFRGLLARIREVCSKLGAPVVVKEVGWGIAPDVVRALIDAGVAGVDVAGAGGTSWSEVERYRTVEPWRARVAGAFASWGIPTAMCIAAAREAAPQQLVIASGGITGGIDAAKAIALGADLVGLAGAFLRAADEGFDTAAELSSELVEVLRISMFALGVRTTSELRGTSRLIRRE
jgi:isopentenyl-diphosphate Delta-isomerase